MRILILFPKMNLKALLFLTLLLFLLTLTLSITISYVNKHVTHFLPYISDTGTVPPESCYFGQGLNLIWVLVSFLMYVKYLQVKFIHKTKNLEGGLTLNKWALITGLLSTFGISIVANFQELNLMEIHWTGAFMVFGFGSVYLCLQSILYFRLAPFLQQRKRNIIRAILSIIASITFVVFFVAGQISYTLFKGENLLAWSRKDGGFDAHLSSSIAEWICGSAIMIYYSMFIWEFGDVSISPPEVYVDVK